MTQENDNANYKVLVVDDEEHIRRILKFQLEKEGYRVITAENGEVALQLVRRESPHLVILDLMMPKVDGFAVCQRIRDNFQTSQIPIIMLTARSDLPDKIVFDHRKILDDYSRYKKGEKKSFIFSY